MTDRARTELIDRYRSGAMSTAEERRFRQELAGDARLRRMFEADELIVGAVRNELASIPTDHAATQAAVMATLATASQTARRGMPAGSVGRQIPLNGSAGFVKTLVTLVAAGGILAGVYSFWPDNDEVRPPTPAAGSVRSEPAPVQQPSESTVAEPAPAVRERSDMQAPAVTTETTPQREGRTVQRRPQRENPTPAQTSPVVQPQQIEQPMAKEKQREIPVRKKDSVRLKIEVKE